MPNWLDVEYPVKLAYLMLSSSKSRIMPCCSWQPFSTTVTHRRGRYSMERVVDPLMKSNDGIPHGVATREPRAQ